jgi:3D (Asp-Asp-Asp) domain-containing protein
MFPYIFAAVSTAVLLFSPGSAIKPSEVMENAALPLALPVIETAEAVETHEVWVTAYSSTPEETDDTPFVTASNTETRDGVVAANFLPFGTKLQIPEHFGDKVFTVEDRMHRRKTNFVDIWMPTKKDAMNFGISYSEIIILERGHEVIAAK